MFSFFVLLYLVIGAVWLFLIRDTFTAEADALAVQHKIHPQAALFIVLLLRLVIWPVTVKTTPGAGK